MKQQESSEEPLFKTLYIKKLLFVKPWLMLGVETNNLKKII